MNATQNNVAIESIEIAHEGLLEMTPTFLAGAAADALGVSVPGLNG